MKECVFGISAWMLSVCVVVAAPQNPRGFAEYDQEVVLSFATEEEAAAAAVTIPELPDHNAMAFSTRWDDWKLNHTNMAATLKAAGITGTWYLNGRSGKVTEQEAEMVALLKEVGTIGSHNVRHDSIPLWMPYLMQYETLMGRIRTEMFSDQPATSVVLPNSVGSCDIGHGTGEAIIGLQIRSGFTAAPEWPLFHLGEDKANTNLLFGTHLFAANDHHPTEREFYRNLTAKWGSYEKYGVPHLTLGVHSHQDAEGFEVLKTIFTDLQKTHPSWWFCNETEYGAWQTQRYYTQVALGECSGTNRTLRLRRLAPHDLGSDIPLSLDIEPAPVRVTVNDAVVHKAKSGVYKIPHHPAWMVPCVIDHVENTNNAALSSMDCASADMPGISAGLEWDSATGTLRGFLGNDTENALSNVHKKIYLARYWVKDPPSEPMADVEAKSKATFEFTPHEDDRDERDEYREGPRLFVVQFDFTLEGKAMRLYASTTEHRDVPRISCPRDCTLFLGPIATNRLDEAAIAALSRPETPLKDLGEGILERWLPILRLEEATDRPFVIWPRSDLDEWKAATKNYGPGVVLTVIEFESEDPEKCCFYRRFRSKYGVYVNGEFVNWGRMPSVKAGRNRLVFVNECNNGWVGPIEYAVSENGNKLDPVKYVTPEVAK